LIWSKPGICLGEFILDIWSYFIELKGERSKVVVLLGIGRKCGLFPECGGLERENV